MMMLALLNLMVVSMANEEEHVDWTQLPVQTAEFVQSINSMPAAAWQAVEYPRFKDKSIAELAHVSIKV